MSNLNNIAQKIKGNTQQVIGEIQQNTGQETKGLWNKTKGKINEKVADLKINKNLNAYNRE